MELQTKYIKCSCSTPEHDVRFDMDRNRPDEVYVSVYLNQYHGFFGRLWVAFKYVFGQKQSYGQFDTTLLDTTKADEVIGLLQDFKKLNAAYVSGGEKGLTDEEVGAILKV